MRVGRGLASVCHVYTQCVHALVKRLRESVAIVVMPHKPSRLVVFSVAAYARYPMNCQTMPFVCLQACALHSYMNIMEMEDC